MAAGGEIRTLDLGGATVSALTDCAPAAVEWSSAFPEADAASRPDLRARWFPDGRFHTRFGVFLVRIGKRSLLVDCGLGPGPVDYFPGLTGELPQALARHGCVPGDIDAVIFTHLHIDHVGWACDAAGRPSFPNARYVVAEAEWLHWSGQGDRAGGAHHVAALRRCVAPLAQAGRLEPCRAGEDILPGVSLMAAAGHTPGHHGVLIATGTRPLLIAGDLWHSPAQVGAPLWCHRADMDKAGAIATRRRIAGWATASGAVIAAGHFPLPWTFGEISADRFIPLI